MIPATLQQEVQHTVARVSRSLERQAAQALQRQTAKIRGEERVSAQLRREREQELARKKRNRDLRLPLAVQGLMAIIEVARLPEIQKLLGLKGEEAREESLDFFVLSRPSGDAWDLADPPPNARGTRDVEISLHKEYVRILTGSRAVGACESWEVFLSRTPEDLGSMIERDRLFSRALIYYDNYPSGVAVAMKPGQRKWEWDPDQLALQVLINCAKQKYLAQYLKTALRRYRPQW